MVDPTPEEVAKAIETLKAFETSLHPVAAPTEPVKSSTEVVTPVTEVVTPVVEVAAPVAAVDPYLARSVKSSPNGF